MNDQSNDFIRGLMRAALFASTQMEKIDTQKLMGEMFENGKLSRRYWEHHPSIQTDVTDADILLLQIDHALDCGDEERFMQLTEELKGMGVLV